MIIIIIIMIVYTPGLIKYILTRFWVWQILLIKNIFEK